MITLGGEVVVDYALKLKSNQFPLNSAAENSVPRQSIWVAGYSNDVMAYIPSERVLAEGGYEGKEAMRFSNLPNPWRRGLENLIVSKVLQLNDRLQKTLKRTRDDGK